MSKPKKIIVTRFSAMGDVAMVASVLREFNRCYPNVHIIMVSRAIFQAFFDDIPNLQYHIFDPKEKHNGLAGLWRLQKELSTYKADAVADLHFNLRSRVLDFLFRMQGIRVVQLDKGRKEKAALIRPHNKILMPLKPTTERYADVFRRLGFSFTLTHQLHPIRQDVPRAAWSMFANQHRRKIGIAPFAQHIYKIFPFTKMEKVIEYLSQNGFDTYIFGGGSAEQQQAQLWTERFPNVYNTIGKLSLREELDLISNLEALISMDSSGMHMASLMGIRCFSLWGATHPYAGFLGYGQSLEDCIQVVHPNRPSSIYGNKSCICDGMEAIDLITPDMVIGKIKELA